MRTKYICRKFILALIGAGIVIDGVISDNIPALICGTIIVTSFIIGESLIDSSATVKQHAYMNKNIYIDTGEKAKEKAEC